MSQSLNNFRHEFSRVLPLIRNIDWQTTIYTPEKACVTALIAKLAYLEIPAFEVRHHSLAKVIPCLTYQELITQGVPVSVVQFFLSFFDFSDTNAFVVTTQDVVAVGLITSAVIFVSLRGTRPLYISDWLVDFHATKTPVYVNEFATKFHTGFYLAISECLERIEAEIIERAGAESKIPIYVVGHSLGGALAGIAYALGGTTYYSKHRYGSDQHSRLTSHAGFTFGMPRYGDADATHYLRSPFHTYNAEDLVPKVPLRGMGFENVPVEYRAGPRGSLEMLAQSGQGIGWLLTKGLRGMPNHFIERYIHRMCKAAGAC